MSTFPNATTLAAAEVTSGLMFPCSQAGARNEVSALNLLGNSPGFDPRTGFSSAVKVLIADDISGSDGDAVATWALSGGTGTAFTGGSGPVLKKAANGINGRNVVLTATGDSAQLTSSDGGASLTGDFYTAAVLNFTGGGLGNIVSWGQQLTAKRRSVYPFGGTHRFIGESADLASSTAVSTGTSYLLEAWYTGGTLYLAVNGVTVASGAPSPNAFAAYSGATIWLGRNPAGSEKAGAKYATIVLTGAVPSAAVFRGFRAWVRDTYGIAVSGGGARQSYSLYSASGLLAAGDLGEGSGYLYTLSKGLVLAGTDAYLVGQSVSSSPATWATPAMLTVNGPVALLGGSAGEILLSNAAADNVAAVWSRGSNYSAIRYLAPGVVSNVGGKEIGAIGGYGSGCIWGGPNRATCWEYSDFINSATYGEGRIVQTSDTLAALRAWFRSDGRMQWYNLSGVADPSTNSVSNPTNLVCEYGRPPTATANDGTLDTGIPTGSGQCGMVVVKDATSSRCAVYRLENTALTVVSANAIFSTTSGNAGTVNVFNNSGQIRLENKTGGSLNLTASYYGA